MKFLFHAYLKKSVDLGVFDNQFFKLPDPPMHNWKKIV